MPTEASTSLSVEPVTPGSWSSRRSKVQPYVGPCPFERRDENRFFGREREARDLVSLTIAHSEVLLYAPSGAGKSSLINARIIPSLEKKGCEVLPVARVQGPLEKLQPEAVPNLYVFHTLASWDCAADPRQLVSLTLADFLKRRSQARDGAQPPPFRVAIFDQFEELFTFYPERWKDREVFLRQIREVLDVDQSVRVLFAMREDYTASLDPYAKLLAEELRTRFSLEQLRRPAALLGVIGPLKGTTRCYAEGVAQKLVDNLLEIQMETQPGQTPPPGEFVEPVQLQVVCQTLWNDLPQEVTQITENDLKTFGDVNQALGRFYERALDITVKETGIREGELRRWFKEKLITPAGTRGTVFRGTHETEGMLNAAVSELEDLHLLRGEFRSGAHWYELTHDRFIRPISESNRRWLAQRAGAEQMRQRLKAQTQEWMEHGQSREHLLDEIGMGEADRWLNCPEVAELGGPGESVLAFLQASRSAVEAARREKERELKYAQELAAAQERRADAERQRAEAEALHAREQARAATRLRRLAWAMTALAAVAVLALVISGIESMRARTARNEADVQRQQAEEQRQQAEKNFKTALGAVDQMLTHVGEQLVHVPQVEEMRKSLLEDALKSYQKFVEQRSTDPSIRLELGRALHRVGNIRMFIGLPSEAEKAYAAEIKIFQELTLDFPENRTYQREAALAYTALGYLLATDSLRRANAEEPYGHALTIQEKLSAGAPDEPIYHKDLGATHSFLAKWLQESGKHQEAAKACSDALKIQMNLVRDHSGVADYQFDLARTYNQLGELLRDSGEQIRAQEYHEKALKLFQALNGKSPANRYYRRNLAVSHHRLGVVLKIVGWNSEAEKHYREALDIQNQLVDDFRTAPIYQQDQAQTYQDLGILLKDIGRLQEIGVAQRLVSAPGDSAQSKAAAPPLPSERRAGAPKSDRDPREAHRSLPQQLRLSTSTRARSQQPGSPSE